MSIEEAFTIHLLINVKSWSVGVQAQRKKWHTKHISRRISSRSDWKRRKIIIIQNDSQSVVGPIDRGWCIVKTNRFYATVPCQSNGAREDWLVRLPTASVARRHYRRYYGQLVHHWLTGHIRELRYTVCSVVLCIQSMLIRRQHKARVLALHVRNDGWLEHLVAYEITIGLNLK